MKAIYLFLALSLTECGFAQGDPWWLLRLQQQRGSQIHLADRVGIAVGGLGALPSPLGTGSLQSKPSRRPAAIPPRRPLDLLSEHAAWIKSLISLAPLSTDQS